MQLSALAMTGALIKATADQARMANSVCHLFKDSFLPSPTSTKADFTAAECDFDGYAPLTIAAWSAPILYSQAWATYAPTQTFRWAHVTSDIGNSVGGYFVVSSAGDLISYATFDPPISVTGPGQAVVTTPIIVTPAGQF